MSNSEIVSQILVTVKTLEQEITSMRGEVHAFLNGDAINDVPGHPERLRILRRDMELSREERKKDVNALWNAFRAFEEEKKAAKNQVELDKKEAEKQRWTVYGGVVVALISLGGTVVVNLMSGG